MAKTRFQVCYLPRSEVIAAAKAKGWTEDGEESLLDVVDHFGFETVDSTHATLDAAVERGLQIINAELDLFGAITVEEQEYRLIVPADNYADWETTVRHTVEDTGLVGSDREDLDA